MSQVPAATRALRVLRFLATQADPVPLEALMRACDLPRSTAYHLVNAMIEEGFVIHLADERRYGLGVAAFETGTGYTRQAPLQRLARRPLAQLVDQVGQSAHLAVLHGRDVLYVVEERAPGRPPLVTDVGVRLPAHLTASGRSVLAHLPAALRTLLAQTRRRGYATEDGEITEGMASVATAVLDHNRHPVAGLAITFPQGGADPDGIARAMTRTAQTLSRRLSGR